MKKFVKNLLLITGIVSIIFLFINYAFVKMNHGKPDEPVKFASIPDGIQLCNFGSSHGQCDYDYANYEDKYGCFNFGLGSQTLSYDYRLFQNYASRITPGAVVFINISYFSFFGIDEIYEKDFLSKNKRYYFILPPDLVKEYELTTDLCVRVFPALGVDFSKLLTTLMGLSPSNKLDLGETTAFDIDIIENADAAFERHIIRDKFDASGKRIINYEEINALFDLINGCKEKGAIPILITTPYLSEYTSAVKKGDPEFFDVFYGIVKQIAEDTGVEYFDYAFDARFSENYQLFFNADHLNIKGAMTFVDILMEEIVYARGYLPYR